MTSTTILDMTIVTVSGNWSKTVRRTEMPGKHIPVDNPWGLQCRHWTIVQTGLWRCLSSWPPAMRCNSLALAWPAVRIRRRRPEGHGVGPHHLWTIRLTVQDLRQLPLTMVIPVLPIKRIDMRPTRRCRVCPIRVPPAIRIVSYRRLHRVVEPDHRPVRHIIRILFQAANSSIHPLQGKSSVIMLPEYCLIKPTPIQS